MLNLYSNLPTSNPVLDLVNVFAHFFILDFVAFASRRQQAEVFFQVPDELGVVFFNDQVNHAQEHDSVLQAFLDSNKFVIRKLGSPLVQLFEDY